MSDNVIRIDVEQMLNMSERMVNDYNTMARRRVRRFH